MPSGFHWLDWLVLIGYFVGITLFGLWLTRRVRNSAGYFLGERKFRWWIMVGQAFGTGTHAENVVAQTGATFQHGFATIWYQWKNMLVTPFYWLLAPWYRRSERTTVGEILEDRYGPRMALAYSIFAIAFFVLNQGVMLQGAAKIISVATGGMVSPNCVVVAMTAAFLLYGFFGGLVAAAYTDFIQGFMIIALSLMLIPLGLDAVGGVSGLREALKPEFFAIYSSASGVTAFTIAMLTVNGIVGITAQPHMVSMCATGETERAGRVGMTYGSFVKRLCTLGWAYTGLIVATLVVRKGVQLPDPEQAFGFACRELLGPGMVGLMVACVLAANMSTCSNFMVNTGALFTRNFYAKYLRPGATDVQLLWAGRISGLGLTLYGALFALSVRNVLHAFLFTETIAAFVGIAVLGGILWRRANRWAAFASVAVAFGLYYFLNHAATGEWKLVYKWTAEPFAWAMLAGFGTLILVSLLTPPEPKERMDAFFDRLSRQSDAPPGPDGRKPLAADRGHDLLLVDITGWFARERWKGFPGRYREDLVGFLLACATVAALVFLAWGIIQFR